MLSRVFLLQNACIESIIQAKTKLRDVTDNRITTFNLHDLIEVVDRGGSPQANPGFDHMFHPLRIGAVWCVPNLDKHGTGNFSR